MNTKKAAALFLAVLMAAVCTVPAYAAADSVYASYVIRSGSVRMTAHRGYSSVAPENTLPAFRLAGEYGFWGAECDISPTADGVWVIMHDNTVDRMTDGTGKVSELTFAEISALTIDAGSNVERFPDTRVPTLTAYLDVCKEYGMHPVIEIKNSAAVSDMPSLAALLSAREEKEMFTIITFESALAAEIKRLLPATPVYLLLGGVPAEQAGEAIRFAVQNGLDGVDFACVWDEDTVRQIRDAGLRTMVWTVDDVDTAERYYAMGVRDFTTNTLTPGKPQPGPGERFEWARRFVRLALERIFRPLEKLFARAC